MPGRKILGCSFPIFLIIVVVILVLFILTLAGGPIGSKILALFGVQFTLPSWLNVPTPTPELPPEPLLHIGSFPITNTMITAWISIVFLILLSYLAFRRPKLVPSGLQKTMEYIFGSLLNFCVSVAGEGHGRRFFPVVATIFIFVITNAWLSLLPFFGNAIGIVEEGKFIPLLRGANTDLNLTLSLALFSFFCIEYFGIKELGFWHYAQKFVRLEGLKKGLKQLFSGKAKSALGTIFFGIIDLVVGALETLSEVIRIVSFSFRLFGNMMAGEILLLVAAFLIPLIFAVPFYGLEFLFSFVQALIFGGLTLVFMYVAVSSHDEEHE